MAGAYPYLVASLPMLHFGMKPPFSFERFLEVCRGWIPERDYRVLSTIPQPEEYAREGKHHRTVRKWIGFDTALRNELARARASRRHLEPGAYLRPEAVGVSFPAPGITAATVHAPPLDAELALDEIRWKALEELAAGHYFDLDLLLTYACRLQILLRWERIRGADAGGLLARALGR
ncbi:MAG: DUF2764 domain-containing protein [Methanomicrobiales archaeon]|nr:DUF2764 domain-containing protein [Methanomicrobiales archaeon]